MPEMTSMQKLRKRMLLQSEFDAIQRALSKEEKSEERIALMRVLKKIGEELEALGPIAVEIVETVSTAVLPDAKYDDPLPSTRARFKGSAFDCGPGRESKF